jgi:dipeptidase
MRARVTAGKRQRDSDRGRTVVRIACDSLVALGEATTDGGALLAKNSDRPGRECQPLVQVGAAEHDASAMVRCQYIEIPQVERTAAFVGSRPFWLWGLEHGLNEHGVAVGNHTVFTREQPQGKKLIGMDLVRLALERAATARAATEVICDLVERHGQGGSGYFDSNFPYFSSFLVADPQSAYVIETSDHRWALRAISDIGSATNHVTIGGDWTRLSADAVDYAMQRGWWPSASAERFDFAAAYRDTSVIPPTFSSGRYRRTCELLAQRRGAIDAEFLRTCLRDHYHGPVYRPIYGESDERYLSVCMHADPIGATTASMVAHIPADRAELACYWGSLGAPCVGVFLPYFPAAELPPRLARGGEQPEADSPWWGFRRLLELVERDWERFGPRARAVWDPWEAEIATAAVAVSAAARRRRDSGDERGALGELTAFMATNVDEMMSRLAALIAELERS